MKVKDVGRHVAPRGVIAWLVVGLVGCGPGRMGPAVDSDGDLFDPDADMGTDGGGDADADADADGDVDSDSDGDGDLDEDPPEDGDIDDGGEPWGGWIGSPCRDAADCDYAAAVCLEDFPEGMCTQACDRVCPDRDGYPVTFCADESDLPAEAGAWDDGACVSRCDYGLYPGTGCREGYGCMPAVRANEPETERYVCLPGEGDPLSDCQEELAALGVSFEPSTRAPEHPSSHPHLTCEIDDPVILHPPIHGVDLVSAGGTRTPSVLAACDMALALVATIDDVAPYGVVALRHMGTYNCRVIAGTDSLSRHAYADAIDIGGFDFDDGTTYTVARDWEHDTTSPRTPGGAWMYEAVYRWHDLRIWNIILTPNYNAAHDDHFHVDLTPGSDFIKQLSGCEYYIGPAPFSD